MLKSDGSVLTQSGITGDFYVQPVPDRKVDPSVECYPPGIGGNQTKGAKSSILAGFMLFVEVDTDERLTSRGPEESHAFASFGNRPKPLPGWEEEFCREYTWVGFCKNTLTEPETGASAMNGGIIRPHSMQVANLMAGTIAQPMDNDSESIKVRDKLIWYPPSIDRLYEGFTEQDLPIATVHPLHWTRECDKHCRKLDWLTLQYQATMVGTDPDLDLVPRLHYGKAPVKHWQKNCIINKADKLTILSAGLSVLAKKGHIEIQSAEISWKKACTDRLIDNILVAKESGAGVGVKVSNAMDLWLESAHSYAKMEENLLANGKSVDILHKVIFIYTVVDGELDGGKIRPIVLGDQSCEKQVLEIYEAKKYKLEDMVAERSDADDAFVAILKRLGLGERGSAEECTWDVLDILKLCCAPSLDWRSIADLYSPIEIIFGGRSIRSQNEDTYNTWYDHLHNGTSRREGVSLETFNDLMNRQVGVAFTPSAVPEDSTYYGRRLPQNTKTTELVITY